MKVLKKITKKKVYSLTLIWFGLVIFNLFLAQDSVEDFFQSENKFSHIAQADFCSYEDSFKNRKNQSTYSLMAFFGGLSTAQRSFDEKAGSDSLFKLKNLDFIKLKNNNHRFTYSSSRVFSLGSRAPPLS